MTSELQSLINGLVQAVEEFEINKMSHINREVPQEIDTMKYPVKDDNIADDGEEAINIFTVQEAV